MDGGPDGMDWEGPEVDYQEFLRAMKALGRKGRGRIIGHLTEMIGANPWDTESLSARGLA